MVFDPHCDVFRDAAIFLYRKWLSENVHGDFSETPIQELAGQIVKNARIMCRREAVDAGLDGPVISQNGSGQPMLLRRVRLIDGGSDTLQEEQPDEDFHNER